jgi:predicted enzyme related to lactoylglutathione lyase
MAMFEKVAFTLYPVVDVPRARRFYEETLGLEPGLAGGQGDVHWIEYDLPGGGCLAISNATQRAPSGAAGGMIALEVADLDRLLEDLRAKGVAFEGDVIQGPRCRMAVCLDTEGNSIVLHQLDRQRASG